jgi:hypothetical protein
METTHSKQNTNYAFESNLVMQSILLTGQTTANYITIKQALVYKNSEVWVG